MPRPSKPSYIVELPLDVSRRDVRRLNGVLDAAKRLYNTVLQEGLETMAALRADPAWAAAQASPKATDEQRQARSEAFRAVRRAHGFSEYDLQGRATHHKNAAGFGDRLGAHVTQKIGTRVFKALEEHLYGQRGRPRFKGVQRPLHSIEAKNNDAALRWDMQAGGIHLSRDWFIPAKPMRLGHDEWLWSALQGEVKYTRLVRRQTERGAGFVVQLVMDGYAPIKASLAARLSAVPENAVAGLDLGPSTIAWCTETNAGLLRFCAEVDAPMRTIRRLQRQVDRQRRAGNPENFDDRGQAKRGCRWVKSKRQRATEMKLRAAHQRATNQRAHAHGRDINQLLDKAQTFRHDGVNVKSLQKNYGRSIGARAPGRFMSELARKAESAGGSSVAVNVRQLKTSQFDHSTGLFVKKTLSERWHVFGDGRGRVQRDVYSAFLALHAVESIDKDGVVTWAHDRERLEQAFKRLEPALVRAGLFKPMMGEGTRAPQGEGDSISPRHGACQSQSIEVPQPAAAPGSRARGEARVESSCPNGLSHRRHPAPRGAPLVGGR